MSGVEITAQDANYVLKTTDYLFKS